MKRAIGYCRVSSEKQVDNYSLDTQEQGIKTWCRRNDLDLVRIFREEGKSARTLDREELQKLRRHCQRSRVDVVVVYKVSRIARDTFDYLYLKKWLLQRGITLRSVLEHFDDSPHGALLETVLASFAQFDNDVRSEQILSGMKAAAKEGRFVWRAPVGYLNNGQDKLGPSLVPDPERADAIRMAFDLASSGLHSRQEITDALNRRGYRTVTDSPFSIQSVDNMLRNPAYKGRLVVPKWKFDEEGDWQPLVTSMKWRQAQASTRRRSRNAAPRQRNSPDFPLRGIVRCANTGANVTGSFSKGKLGKLYAYYHTQKVKPCLRVPRQQMHTELESLLDQLRPEPEILDLWQVALKDVIGNRHIQARQERERAHKRLEKLRKDKKQLVRTFAINAKIDETTFDELAAELDEEIADAESLIASSSAAEPDFDVEEAIEKAGWLISSGRSIWRASDLPQRQRFLQLLFPSGLSYHRNRGYRTPETLSVFRPFRPTGEGKSKMVEPKGIEPSTS